MLILDAGLLMLLDIIMSGCPKDFFGELVETILDTGLPTEVQRR
jgi:hypothetical protein